MTDADGTDLGCTATFQKVDDQHYYVFVKGISLAQMRKVVNLTIYNGENAVSNTLTYSIESYVYKNQNALTKAMIKLGDAIVAYMSTEQ